MKIYVTMLSLVSVILLALTASSQAQLILNEANATSADNFLDSDPGKLYEGFDYGALSYSGNDNPVNDPVEPGNPFPSDLSTNSGIQTTLPNGFDLSQATGWARIRGNGGDWIELVVTEDHTDLRGYTLFWENDESIGGAMPDNMPGLHPDERGFIKFTNDQVFADLRAGTIITLSEDAMVDEIRDKYPPTPFPNNPLLHDTGFDYDLSTDTSFDPYGADDWHVHFHVDETLTDQGIATQYFEGFSDVKVDNDLWQMAIFDATNTSVVEQTEDEGVEMVDGLDVGLVQDRIGELVDGWGDNTGAGGIGNSESLSLNGDPVSGITAADYEDIDWSTFGAINMYNLPGVEASLTGVQDFSHLRNPVLSDTHDWVASGTADFGTAANWINADAGATPGTGPQPTWTVRLNNDTGVAKVAQVTSDTTIAFATVSGDSGSMTLDVQNGSTLTVQGGIQPGRVLVFDGGNVLANGQITADAVEAFSGGIVSGNGTIVGNLINSGGTIAPGTSEGQLTVAGSFSQGAGGTLAIELGGTAPGEFDTLAVSGTADLAGDVQVALSSGFTPIFGNAFAVLTSGTFNDNGFSLSGASGFTSFLLGDNQLVLSFTAVSPDFDADGDLDLADIDSLVVEIVGNGNAANFDLTGDGSVDADDLSAWLVAGGNINNASGNPYLEGDANLDGFVDGQDFITWNANKFQPIAAWSAGDFNADGFVDGQDFIVWNQNKFQSAASQVPEPSSVLLVLGLGVGLAALLRKRG